MKKKLFASLLIFPLMFSGCSCIPSDEDYEARKVHIMEVMKERIVAKYNVKAEDIDIHDLSKGGNQAWFNYGFYPAKGTYQGEEFDVELKTDGKKRFDSCKDSLYGVLYGKEVLGQLEELVSDYEFTDVRYEYQTSEDLIKDENLLKQNLRIHAKYTFYGELDLDNLCFLVDKLNEEGYQHWLSITNAETNRTRGERSESSEEIKALFPLE